MRIDKSSYRLFGDHIEYSPVSGIEIRQAIQDGFDIYAKEKKPVTIHINDIDLVVKKDSILTVLVNSYYVKLEQRHRLLYPEVFTKNK